MLNKDKLKKDLKELVETIIFVIVAVILIRFFIAELRYIPSGSMKPTLLVNDRVVVEKLTKIPTLLSEKKFENVPKRGDIMIFYPPFVDIETTPLKLFCRLTGFCCKDLAYIKRVIGLPGERIEIRQQEDGRSFVYINNKRLEEDYIMSDYGYHACKNDMFCGPFVIPEGHYFMMGDNRGNSQDSRFWGTLPQERFIGRAVSVYYPFNRLRMLTK